MTISKKMILTIATTMTILIIASVIKITGLNSIKSGFDKFLNKVTTSRVLVTEISEDLNYISRCTRDIMLGNAYEKNIEKIEKRKMHIEEAFDKLHEITDEPQMKELITSSKQTTLVFIKDGYEKMLSLKNKVRTQEVLDDIYQEYKKDATPLANKSRKYFSQMQKRISDQYDQGVKEVEDKIYSVEYKVAGETLFIFVFIMIVLLSTRKTILKSIKSLKNSINEIVIERGHSSKEIEISKDEFGEIQTMLNDYVIKVEKENEEDEKLIQEVKTIVNKVSGGDLTARINSEASNPELKELKDNMNSMLVNLEKNIGKNIVEINTILSQYASSDYTGEIQNDKGNVVQGVKKVGKAITAMLNNNKRTSIQLEDLAEQLKEKVAELNGSSTQQAANLEEVTASIGEIANNLRNSSENASLLLKNSNGMHTMAVNGGEMIKEMAKNIEEINGAQQKITDAITVIDQIAFQTNILSLNAAVEAATAGEHGKGFAVVATEVRNLAAKSTEAATDIKDLVKNGTNLIEQSTKLSNDVKVSFEELLESIEQTNTSATAISDDTNDQMRNMEQIASTMNSLDTATQNNAILAQDTNELATMTEKLAKSINDEIDKNQFHSDNK